jgi:hypothetical protein
MTAAPIRHVHPRRADQGPAGPGAGARRRIVDAAPPPSFATPAVVAAPPPTPDDTPLSGLRPTRGVAVSCEVREL